MLMRLLPLEPKMMILKEKKSPIWCRESVRTRMMPSRLELVKTMKPMKMPMGLMVQVETTKSIQPPMKRLNYQSLEQRKARILDPEMRRSS